MYKVDPDYNLIDRSQPDRQSFEILTEFEIFLGCLYCLQKRKIRTKRENPF